jgi:hypothetical protein
MNGPTSFEKPAGSPWLRSVMCVLPSLVGDMNSVPLDADLGAQFRTEADRTLAAWTARGLDGEVDVRTFAGFDPAVPVGADADPTDQLVAFLGRRP